MSPSCDSGSRSQGPVDHDVPVLQVDRADGALLAVVFGYACHCTVLDCYKFCGDYAGFAQVDLETRHPGAQAMFVAGCGGDQNPIPRARRSSWPPATANNSPRASSRSSADRSQPIDGGIEHDLRRDPAGLRRPADERADRARHRSRRISTSPAGPGICSRRSVGRGPLEPSVSLSRRRPGGSAI